MWGMITALVSGALMSIQGVFNSAVMKQTSMWVSAGWVQISAFVVCLLMWLFTGINHELPSTVEEGYKVAKERDLLLIGKQLKEVYEKVESL